MLLKVIFELENEIPSQKSFLTNNFHLRHFYYFQIWSQLLNSKIVSSSHLVFIRYFFSVCTLNWRKNYEHLVSAAYCYLNVCLDFRIYKLHTVTSIELEKYVIFPKFWYIPMWLKLNFWSYQHTYFFVLMLFLLSENFPISPDKISFEMYFFYRNAPTYAYWLAFVLWIISNNQTNSSLYIQINNILRNFILYLRKLFELFVQIIYYHGFYTKQKNWLCVWEL